MNTHHDDRRPHPTEPEAGEDVYRVHTTGPRGWLRRWHLELRHGQLNQVVPATPPTGDPLAHATSRHPDKALTTLALAAVEQHFTTAPSQPLILCVGDLRLSDESVYALALGSLRLAPELVR